MPGARYEEVERTSMPRLTLPSITRPSFNSRSTGVFVVAFLVLSLGTAATAVTAELSNGVGLDHPAASTPLLGPTASTPTAAPVTSPAAKAVKLSTKPKRLIEATLLVSRQ